MRKAKAGLRGPVQVFLRPGHFQPRKSFSIDEDVKSFVSLSNFPSVVRMTKATLAFLALKLPDDRWYPGYIGEQWVKSSGGRLTEAFPR
jgi:hypothetical protein